MITVRQYAENILLAESLSEKLAPPPPGLSLDPPSKQNYRTPTLPGRPEALRPRSQGETRTKIPSVEQLKDEEHRAVLLHFFCNHELLAVELMALALLKFPNAPNAFRQGLLHTLQEEQEHTRLYLDRMAATGTKFGDHSLSSMIWDHIATMESPIEYVSRLSLTFEQSNLDYAKHYSQAFAKVGDSTTSNLLAKIYKDEIAHVGYGLKWLRRFKKQQETDWDAWHRSLAHPLSPVRAKAPDGTVPFNHEGRQKAGLNPDFISKLQIYQRSRGRTPHVHFFNPNSESHVAAWAMGTNYQNNKIATDLEQDLEALLLVNTHPDDIALMRHPPSNDHLNHLRKAGLALPEIVSLSEKSLSENLASRKLGGFRPWAWSPEVTQLFAPLAHNPTENTHFPWQDLRHSSLFQRTLSQQAVTELGLSHNSSYSFTQPEEAFSFLEKHLPTAPYLLKPQFSCAGRGQLQLKQNSPPQTYHPWIKRNLKQQGTIVIEPFLPRILDFSALYDLTKDGEVRFLSFTQLKTDSQGRYQGTKVAPKIGNLFPSELTVKFHQEIITSNQGLHSGTDFYRKILPKTLSNLLSPYSGPVAVDAFFYQFPGEEIKIRPLVEINPRCSMGRIAHNLRRKLAPNLIGELTIHRLAKLQKNLPQGLLLNDPDTAKSFLASWQSFETKAKVSD